MAFEKTWRWFGPNDPISLKEIKQTGATGIVTALHHIPIGEVWTVEEILKRKNVIESEGFQWSVVESVPVHEDIKKRKGNYELYINNYKETIRNLGKCGIDTVCYNFMPILDWSRTDLETVYEDGSITSKFETKAFAAFDIFILKRNGAEKDYTDEQTKQAEIYFKNMNDKEKEKLINTILFGLPGSWEAYSLEEFKKALNEYSDINDEALQNNLIDFIKEIIPVAEESNVFLVVHPDDPPRSLLGLPRIVSSKSNIEKILKAVDSIYNGLTLCTGSLGAGFRNDVIDIARSFADRINFLHLRNVTRNSDGDFMEADHLNGDINLYEIMKILLYEQKRRINAGRKDIRMPMRPDHGRLMIPEQNKKGIYPGYSLFGRMRALAELRGLELGIICSEKLF